ncbi:MAG: hypothetical protein J2P17_17675 [Mycobacterium sp.]|nr:hypothetical protein [Mycobacterium sp.]
MARFLGCDDTSDVVSRTDPARDWVASPPVDVKLGAGLGNVATVDAELGAGLGNVATVDAELGADWVMAPPSMRSWAADVGRPGPIKTIDTLLTGGARLS